MSAVAKSIIAATLPSQIAAMSGKVATVQPQSSLARFIFGELKGGEHKHNYSMSVIRAAVEQAFKGNTRDIPEAVRLCDGKAVKAKAYCAGFHAIADMVAPVAYTGKFDSKENAEVRALVAQSTEQAMRAFEVAYLDVFECAKLEAKAKKADKEAKNVPAPVAAPAPVAPAPVIEVAAEVVNIGDMVATLVNAIQTGLLESDEMTLIRAALASYDAAVEQKELLAA